MYNCMKAALRLAGVFAGALLLLWLLLCAAASIPNELLRPGAERSVEFYAGVDPFAFTQGGRFNSLQDNYADAILTNIAWNMGGGSPFASTLVTRYTSGGGQGENVGLRRAVMEGAPPDKDYSRYWHGTALVLRPLLLVTDVEGVKWIGFSAILLLFLLTAALLIRRGAWEPALALAASLAAVQVWNVRPCMEYQPCLVLAFLLCPAWLLLERKGNGPLLALSVLGGAATAFFDFLTTETLTILLPLLLVLSLRIREGRLDGAKGALPWVCGCLLAWGCAYLGAFLVKWTAATLVSGENQFTAALASTAERVGGTAGLGSNAPRSVLSSLSANLTTLFGGTARSEPARALLGVLAAAALLGSVYYLFRGPAVRGAVLLPGLGALVFLRFLVLNNHSCLHAFFTCRALASTIFALLAALLLNRKAPGKRRKAPCRK